MIDLSKLTTEQENPRTKQLSAMGIREAIEIMNEENLQAVKCIESQYDRLERVIEMTSDALERGRRIVYIGAGTSGRIGLLDAVECPPTFGVDYETVIGLIAGGENAFVKAVEGAEDSKEQGRADLEAIHLSKEDVVIGLAASGRTPYVIGALEYARQIGAHRAAIVCNEKSPISQICPLTIEAIAGPEVLTGSTRLKAGTATKLICNMISTLSMIRIGKVYKNYMVDVKMTNEKLKTRAVNIVMSVTDCSKEQAQKALEMAQGQVRNAIVMILLGCSKEEAEAALEQAGGQIQKLVKEEQ
ncbi:N-acetylmuramic acid 6-phosphate etherase [Dubosiella newyorkensis]|uniref:N-acetylmuramic acid 6-phosphate etherase n=1 Tax=Dubosiella newyorkensis TaxID=1862672 RepID=A0A1U7NP95_9FIRM|nr:N-acetylmuramic acid 6-phosphate etherase [Dubosiella newyorkensis]OLU47395.1 N-acetylmuramic acid 6-phosphate etherase [Dubosiella newyorkensis]